MTLLRILPVFGLLACAALSADDAKKLPPASTAAIDFDTDVKPILAAHCVKCHGAEKQRGGLRLDDRKAALDGGNSGAVIVATKSADSKLIHAVAGLDPDAKMPPEGPALTAAQVGILRAWIDQGAKWGADTSAKSAVTKSNHWSFQPITRPTIPNGAAHPIDAFIRARLAGSGLPPSPEADRFTLIRRASIDLTGLPPTPDEIDAFVKDTSADAFEKVVDRLLASPHYGERWGRHWLDSARYADSDGYEKDTGRPFAWRYRDWVIQALNADTPFDRFTVEQLAGDLLPNATVEQKTATGFHRNTLTNKEGGADQEEFRVAAVVDRVNTTGKVWLGLTVGCAQCHDHKYDPLSQREFYQLFAYFNSDKEADIPAPLPGEEEKVRADKLKFDAKLGELKAAVSEGKAKKLPDAEQTKRAKALAAHEKTAPAVSKAMTMALGKERPTHVMIRGDFLRKGVPVKAGTPAVLPSPGGATRLDLARWLVASDNPLTPRVAVNWVWAKFFGRGLVATAEDFGTQGEKPSHPELLDWLASEFVTPANPERERRGATPNHPVAHAPGSPAPWSLKRLHRLVVTSATYRQSSAVSAEALKRDPLNVLLARQSRLRLEAEIVRDGALAASGLLNRTVGGPSIRPPQPPGISELTYANSAKWPVSTGPERYKRGLYVWFQRTSPYPMLMTFDSPDSNVCVVRRERSNTPLQALTLLNDTVFVEAAQALARRVLSEKTGDPERLSHALRLCVGRTPTAAEGERLAKLLATFRELSATADAAKLVGDHKPAGVELKEAAAWVALARTLLNLDEFVTRE